MILVEKMMMRTDLPSINSGSAPTTNFRENGNVDGVFIVVGIWNIFVVVVVVNVDIYNFHNTSLLCVVIFVYSCKDVGRQGNKNSSGFVPLCFPRQVQLMQEEDDDEDDNDNIVDIDGNMNINQSLLRTIERREWFQRCFCGKYDDSYPYFQLEVLVLNVVPQRCLFACSTVYPSDCSSNVADTFWKYCCRV